MFDSYISVRNAADEIRAIQSSNIDDYAEIMRQLDTIASIQLMPIVKKYKHLYELFDLAQELDTASNFVSNLASGFKSERSPEELRDIWFKENFHPVKQCDIIHRLCHWHEVHPDPDSDLPVLPPYLYEAVHKDESTLIDRFADDTESISFMYEYCGLRVFYDDEVASLYIGAPDPYTNWLEPFYETVYTSAGETEEEN